MRRRWIAGLALLAGAAGCGGDTPVNASPHQHPGAERMDRKDTVIVIQTGGYFGSGNRGGPAADSARGGD